MSGTLGQSQFLFVVMQQQLARRARNDCMGMMLVMNCQCGYSTDITIGGNKRNHMSVCIFPHFCKHCGVVNANLYSEVPCCPTCLSSEIIMYGEMEKTKEFSIFGIRLRRFDKNYWVHDERVTRPEGDNHENWSNLRLPYGDHFCPSCLKMELRLSRESICFFD